LARGQDARAVCRQSVQTTGDCQGRPTVTAARRAPTATSWRMAARAAH